MSTDRHDLDVVILGGGIAGLWLLRLLRARGYAATVIDPHPLGTGQTIAAQGIIHSGLKYGFDGVARPQTEVLARMPEVWRNAFAGRGEVSLRRVDINQAHTLLLATGEFRGAIVARTAAHLMRSVSSPVPEPEWPKGVTESGFNGAVFKVGEPVIATKPVLQSLAREAAYQGEAKFEVEEADRVELTIRSLHGVTELTAGALVHAAGIGNEKGHALATQRRPLRMIMVRGPWFPVFGHWVVPAPKPRLTITSHFDATVMEWVWYIGGDVAEKSVGMDEPAAIEFARAELTELFPFLPWKAYEWAIHDVTRAEAAGSPAMMALHTAGRTATIWPGKLALAPALAEQTLAWIEGLGITPRGAGVPLPLPAAAVAKYPWETCATWRVLA